MIRFEERTLMNAKEALGSCFWWSLLLIGSQLISNGVAMAQASLPCERETISMLVSPDNAWVALVEEGVCGRGALTVSTDTVRLLPRDAIDEIHTTPRLEKAEYENDILVMDDYGHPENRPRTQWLSPHKLQITIPNISAVGLQKSSYQNVQIVIKYEPDDVDAREAWRKERGLAPK